MNKPKFWPESLLVGLSCLALVACGGSSTSYQDYEDEYEPVYEIPEDEDPDGDNGEVLVNVTNDDPELFDNVIADFEDVAFMQDPANGWVLSGIFADVNDWRGVTNRPEAARVGQRAVSTCEIGGNDCDSNTGSILTPPFTVESDYINFLMTGGATDVGLELRSADDESVLVSFQPDSCGRAFITDDDDWHHLDVSALRGEEVQLFLFDHEEGGCGFISFDHFYQSGSAIGNLGAQAAPPLEAVNVSLPSDSGANIISRFDDALRMVASIDEGGEGWQAEGDFADPQSADAWEGPSADPAAARIGERAFSSCATGEAACESLTGRIVSAPFTVAQNYIRFLAVGGSESNQDVAINLLNASSGEVLASFTPETCTSPYMTGDQDWHQFDVSDIQGQRIRLEIVDDSTEECGYISIDHAYQTGSESFTGESGDQVVPGSAGIAEIPAEFQSQNVDVAPDAFDEDRVISSFDSPTQMIEDGWTGTGAFANPADDNAWKGTTASSGSARVGLAAISTCEINDNAEGCDAPTGRLTSPITKIIEDYIYFLMLGGNGDAPVGLRILDSIGNEVHNYTSAKCGPSHIESNDDWTFIDQSNLMNAMVHYQFYDEEDGGCGFLSFDHLYQSDRDPFEDDGILPVDMNNGGMIIVDDQQLQSIGFNASLPYADSNERVIGRFDDAIATLDDEGWTATGDFASPGDSEAWQGTTSSDAAARIGAGAVSTCELNHNADGCDAPTGTLTSPDFTVDADKPLLVFMMGGGNGGDADVGLRVLLAADDSEVASYTPDSCGPSHLSGNHDWSEIDLSDYAGQAVKVEIYDNEPGGCGFITFDHVHMSNGEAYTPE
ncbi:hypothetical protein [Marinimicrobium alkaliphilum]|uniref:hypothetical protein n=1 Tax=Marinimicrobium alkaliphilum TaxID=2202654 RepID=UPI000DBAB399|nr:hypothetical protein [Marinimicrobium alkaliphilum]